MHRAMNVRRGLTAAAAYVMAVAALLLTLGLQERAFAQQWSGPNASGHITNTNPGNVGIGTASPGSILQAASATRPTITIETTGTTAKSRLTNAVPNWLGLTQNAFYDGVTGWNLDDTGRGAWIFGQDNVAGAENAFLSFLTPGTNPRSHNIRFYVNKDGNVGIGTTNPSARKLEVHGSSNTALMRMVGNSSVITEAGSLDVQGQGYVGTFSNHPFTLQTNNTEWVRVTTSGNVGIGTTSPGRRLEVLASDGEAARLYRNGNGLNWGVNIMFALNNSSNSRVDYAGVHGMISSATAGAENGNLVFTTVTAGSLTEKMRVDSAGNVGIGIASPTKKLHVVGDVEVTGNIAAKYQDVAEWVPSTQKLSAGTVVVLDTARTNHVVASTTAYDTGVAGVVSEMPGLILGEAGDSKLKVATTGRVKVKVDATHAPIKIGDLLVTGETPGVAMRSETVSLGGVKIHRPGTIIGKALEPLDKGVGVILVLLSLQ